MANFKMMEGTNKLPDFGKVCPVTLSPCNFVHLYPCFSLGNYTQYKVAAFVKSNFYLTSDNIRRQGDDRELTSGKERTSGGKRSTPKKDGRYRL